MWVVVVRGGGGGSCKKNAGIPCVSHGRDEREAQAKGKLYFLQLYYNPPDAKVTIGMSERCSTISLLFSSWCPSCLASLQYMCVHPGYRPWFMWRIFFIFYGPHFTCNLSLTCKFRGKIVSSEHTNGKTKMETFLYFICDTFVCTTPFPWSNNNKLSTFMSVKMTPRARYLDFVCYDESDVGNAYVARFFGIWE